jgi:hypothetical protein
MCDLNQIANELRAIEAAARDARAVAQGLRDAASVCSHEQAALKKRLEVAAVALALLRGAADNAAATLRGVRNMAVLEVRAGSKPWHRALELIDASLKELA